MNVLLTCACGLRQEVPVALAGKKTACAGCGRALSVPAIGVVVPVARKGPAAAKPTSVPAPFAVAPIERPMRKASRGISSRWANCLLLALCGILSVVALGVGGVLLGWHEPIVKLVRAAQVDPQPMPAELTPLPSEPLPPENSGKPPAPNERPPRANVEPTEPVPPAVEPPVAKPLDKEPPTVAKPLDKGPPTVAKPVVPEKPAVPAVKVARPFKEGDTFLQELVVTQKSRFVVSGIQAATMLKYRIVSRYTVEKVQDDGAMTVQQKIEAAELMLADDLTQGLLADRVTRMPGMAFTLELTARGEVTKFTGAGATIQAAKLPGGLGVQMASLLDADGWKEMAQATFYHPEQLAKAGVWTRPTTHNWGPLGGWAGKISYAYPGPAKDPQVKVPYTQKIVFQPRKGPGAPGALPFQIAGSNFQPPQAGGTLLFDTERGKVVAAEERFHVRGAVALILLGQNTPADIEEEQVFQMRLGEK
jgi:hypothetical protein